MIGIVLVTYGDIGQDLIEDLTHIQGSSIPNVQAVRIENILQTTPDEKIKYVAEIKKAMKAADEGQGVVFLTDGAGFESTTLALAAAATEPSIQTDVLSGVNLPTLIKLAGVRAEKSLPEAVASAQAAGKKYIVSASTLLSGNNNG